MMTVSSATKVALSAVIYCIGTGGNVLVIFMIFYLGETKKISHWYILQLALADVIFLQSLPFYMMEVIVEEFTHPDWLCTLKQTLLYINYYGSIIFLSIMAIDRYLAVCHGLSKLTERLRSRQNCYIITLFVWIICILMCIPVMMYAGLDVACQCSMKFPPDKELYCEGRYNNASQCETGFAEFLRTNGCERQNYTLDGDYYYLSGDYSEYFETEDEEQPGNFTEEDEEQFGNPCVHPHIYPGLPVFLYYNFAVMFVLPLVIISVCYGLIVLRLRNTNAKVRRNSERSDSSGQANNENSKLAKSRRRKSSSSGLSDRHKNRITVMSAMLVVVFVICWLPYNAVQLAKIEGYLANNCEVGETITMLLVYVNSALNPYLYNFLGTFSKRMREIRKHRRTREILDSFRWTKMRSLSRHGSGSFKARKDNDGSFHITQTSAVRDETQRPDSSTTDDNALSPESQKFV